MDDEIHAEAAVEQLRAWFVDESTRMNPSLLLGGLEFGRMDYLATWKRLEADPETFEVLRNLPMRHPLLWADNDT